MKIIAIKSLPIPAVKVIQFARFQDMRGYFTETFRKSDFAQQLTGTLLRDVEFRQCNESFSRRGTIRGLHFQWNPYMGKLVRTIHGHMVDIVLDIRQGSPTYGQAIFYDMPAKPDSPYGEWIWVPPGFAHGNFFLQDTHIEYFCSGEYNGAAEAGILPFAKDIDWRLAEPALKALFDQAAQSSSLITEKDKNGFTLNAWQSGGNAGQFVYRDEKKVLV